MWWVQDPVRLKQEVAAIERLQIDHSWLSTAVPRALPAFRLGFDFDITVSGVTHPFLLTYPALFPAAPPQITPRDGRRLSGHQYGDGGELCLEYRADNWDPAVSGAMMIESAHRLLVAEDPDTQHHAPAPSAHRTSIGQDLRSQTFRFLVTRSLLEHVGTLPCPSIQQGFVKEAQPPKKIWTAHVGRLGSETAPDWVETGLAIPGSAGEACLLLRVATLDSVPTRPDHAALERLVQDAGATPAEFFDDHSNRFVVLATEHSARAFFSYLKAGERHVIPYQTVDFSDDVGGRLPPSYATLQSKKVGLVGCGSLGSKIAASLARCGVGAIVLVDDDILKPGNLLRHELDGGSVGAHKVDALEARLLALSSGIKVRAFRVALGGQESSGGTAIVLDELATCDLLIDATADAHAFNFVAAAARSGLHPMVWAEVYAGGIGGFVARVRPDKEPPPHSARRQYLAWCHDQGVPWHGGDREYGAAGPDDRPLIADDADVAVIAAHATRLALDTLIQPAESAFPHPAYAVGFAAAWIFTAPFDTRPIDFGPDGPWSTSTPEKTEEAIDFMVALLKKAKDEGRTDTGG
ncbi:MAG: ThiF family adenylyltransferase [Rhodospirillales bacterium]|nr:MAG: ThiF family adenylyltransferase [Rhodospirillales bacterium]